MFTYAKRDPDRMSSIVWIIAGPTLNDPTGPFLIHSMAIFDTLNDPSGP